MVTGYEVKFYRDIERIAESLEEIEKILRGYYGKPKD